MRRRRPDQGNAAVGRQDYAGTLTGDYIDHSDPPWRWYLMKDLTLKPQGCEDEAIWCLEGNLFSSTSDLIPGPVFLAIRFS